MADEEPKIPVFSVLKNGVILKNIFVINNSSAADDADRASEVILNAGRHHDCHILLTHPSISRFHLRIYSNPSLQKLSVMDLSSVHGTWVNYMKIEPGIRVELNEGDTLGVGSSSRVYKLHWVPLNQAYDTKCSFLPSLIEEKEEETAENWEGVENEQYVEQKSIREELGSNVLPIDEETVEAYWDDLLNIDYWEYDGYKFPSEDKDHEILACGEGEVIEQKSIREEVGSNVLPIDEETVEAYWDNLLKIDYWEYDGYKFPSEDKDQEILACGEGEVIETAQIEEVVTENQAHDIEHYLSALHPPSVEEKEERAADNGGLSVQVNKVDPGEYEYRDTLEEIGRGTVEIDEEKEETAKVEGETMEAYWDDLLKIDYGEFGEYKYQLEDMVGESEVMETAKVGEIVTADQIVNGEFGEYKDQLEQSNENILAGGEDATEASQVGDLLQTANEEVNEEIHQGILESNSEVASLDMIFEGLGSPILNESCGLLMKEETPMRLPVPQRMDSSSSDEDITDISAETNLKGGQNCIACPEFAFSECMTFSLPPVILLEADVLGAGIATESAFDAVDENLGPQNEDSRSCLPVEIKEFDSKSYEAENSSSGFSQFESSPLLSPEVVAATKCKIPCAENPMLVPTGASESKLVPEIDSPSDSKKKQSVDTIESTDAFLESQGNHPAFKADDQGEGKNMEVEENDEESSIHLEDPAPDSLLLNDENQTVLFSFLRRHIQFTESSTPRLGSRIGKPATVIQLQTDKRSRKSRSMGLNADNRQQIMENDESIFVARDLSAELDRAEEESLDQEKENMTPYSLKLRFKKEIGKFGLVESPSDQLGGFQTKEDALNSLDEENLVHTLLSESVLSQDKQVTTYNSGIESTTMKTSFSPKFLLEEDVSNSSTEETQTPKSSPRSVIPEVNERGRSCFRSSQVESELSTVAKLSSGEKKHWIMVADTSSFLDKESRKSLQLLQGLQGTQLVIPRIVMRELDSLKNKPSLFGRKTEAASALEWIEEATALYSNWLIHIQSSAEEDSVLDYALVFRTTNTNAHTVLLTNDISLKIKAMAEGLLCETPQEFRSSLVNPFSDRFMWAASAPMGRTWSCSDDVVLKEWYCGQNGAKGLKLILPCKWYY